MTKKNKFVGDETESSAILKAMERAFAVPEEEKKESVPAAPFKHKQPPSPKENLEDV